LVIHFTPTRLTLSILISNNDWFLYFI